MAKNALIIANIMDMGIPGVRLQMFGIIVLSRMNFFQIKRILFR